MCPLYDPVGRLSLAMAGNGDPYAVLTPRLLRVLRDLHQGLPLSGAADRAATTVLGLRAELASLVAAGSSRSKAGSTGPPSASSTGPRWRRPRRTRRRSARGWPITCSRGGTR